MLCSSALRRSSQPELPPPRDHPHHVAHVLDPQLAALNSRNFSQRGSAQAQLERSYVLSTLYENPLPTVYDPAARVLPGALAPAAFTPALAARVNASRREEWEEHTRRVFGDEATEQLL